MFSNYAVPARRLLVSTLVTNLGNGMNTLVVGKLLYDRTGSAASFGGVIVAEFLTALALQLFAGSLTDRFPPRRSLYLAELLRGLVILACALAVLVPALTVPAVLFAVLTINVGKAFYRAAVFAYTAQLVPQEQLAHFNAQNNALFQTGQLLGLALAAPLIQFLGTPAAFAFNGLSFVASALLVGVPGAAAEAARDDGAAPTRPNVLADWAAFVGRLRDNRLLLALIVLACGDFLSVALMNLHLVPLVDRTYGGQVVLLSLFDGALALGSLALLFVLGKRISTLDTVTFGAMGLFVQALCVFLMSRGFPPLLNAAVMVVSGAGTALSLAMFATSLQRHSLGGEKGKTTSARIMVTSVLALAVIPVATALMHRSIEWSLLFFSGTLATFGAATALLAVFLNAWAARRTLGASATPRSSDD
ncbi:major facilitator superfamily MFS_1 [Deinococcus aerius]|uniref:Major facilitator superfamily MFS_1 n=1 Tax=Deinococcus aerius TaxID=200253 RepID=A0A2I9CSR1_9DEIO|nr:MFS transporter [Deinococcus aerius]GBF04732.1 major facilitator superfamily MFS_1 [Deinococcus aerius]